MLYCRLLAKGLLHLLLMQHSSVLCPSCSRTQWPFLIPPNEFCSKACKVLMFTSGTLLCRLKPKRAREYPISLRSIFSNEIKKEKNWKHFIRHLLDDRVHGVSLISCTFVYYRESLVIFLNTVRQWEARSVWLLQMVNV